MKYIDNFLNSITMYRLVLYGLILMAAVSVLFGFMGLLPFGGFELIVSSVVLVTACYLLNYLFSTIYRTPRNNESSLITGLILFFVVLPAHNISTLLILIAASALAMASKYVLAVRGKHLFNPTAISVVILGVLGLASSAWWVASPYIAPFVIIIGLLIVRKIRRFSMFFTFVLASLFSISLSGYLTSAPLFGRLVEIAISWPLIYFATFMLTEPLTTPPTRKLQMVYGAIIGILFGSQFRFGPVYSTPELALVIGNIFSFLVSPKQSLRLKFQKKVALGADTYDYSFLPDQKLRYSPGQYLEWTLSYPHPDSRGNRRYFTVASSPTEKELKLGVKISSQQSSGFKKSLLAMNKGDEIFASQLAGDFVLPQDKNVKLAFVAGGIGITPFRSMIRYLMDNNQRRDIVLFYTAATADGFVYKDLLEKAKTIGLKPIYVPTNEMGRLTPDIIRKEALDYQQRIFYLSGPNAMVTSYKKLLLGLGVKRKNIVTDYFPGY